MSIKESPAADALFLLILNLMKPVLTAILLFVALLSSAQNGLPPNAGAKGAAMGNISAAFQGIYSAFSNPAGLATLPHWGVAAMGEQRFLIPEIRSVAAAGAVTSGIGTFGVHLHYFGLEEYNEQRLGLLYARPLFEYLSLGISLDLLNTRIPDYGSQLSATGSVGLQVKLADPLWLGVHLFNPFRIRRNNGEYYPTLLRAGFSYQASERVLLCGEAEKDIDFPLRWKGGLEYRLLDVLSLRGGFSTQPAQGTFGASLSWKTGLSLDFAFQWNQLLGWTPAFSIIYQAPERG